MFVQRKIFSTPFCHTSCTSSTLGECLRGFFALFIGAKIITKATTTRKFAYCRESCSIYCTTNRVSPRCSQNKTDKNSNRNFARVLTWWGVLRTQAVKRNLFKLYFCKSQLLFNNYHNNRIIIYTIVKPHFFCISFFTSFFVCEKGLNLSHCYLLFTLGI